MYLKEVCQFMHIPATNPQRFVQHRWLSAYNVSIATKRMLPAYKVLYYGFLSAEDKALYRDPLEALFRQHNVSEKAQQRIFSLHGDLNKKGRVLLSMH